MSNVRDVVIETMQGQGLGGYLDQAKPVIDALADRDENIANTLMDAGVGMGASRETVRDLMFEVGLLTRPVAVAEPTAAESNGHGDGDIAAALARIEEQLGSLTQFARANGYRG